MSFVFGYYNLNLQAALMLQYLKSFNSLLICIYIVDMAYKNYGVILFIIIVQASNFQGILIVYNNEILRLKLYCNAKTVHK